MNTNRLTPDLIAALTAVDTATICNAIEIVEAAERPVASRASLS